MVQAGTIKLCANIVDGGQSSLGVGARVDCYDYDPGNEDDYMGGGILDSNGCISINYKSNSGWNCWNWWDACLNKKPDIYCKVSGDCLEPTTTGTRNGQNPKGTTNFGTINVQADENFCGNPSFNGCGAASFPDWLREVADDVSGFQTECNAHDVCYGDCSRTKSQCDDEFLDDMEAEAGNNSLALILANIFYQGVAQFGNDACLAARNACPDGPETCSQ